MSAEMLEANYTDDEIDKIVAHSKRGPVVEKYSLSIDEIKLLPQDLITKLANNTAILVCEVAFRDYQTYIEGRDQFIMQEEAFTIDKGDIAIGRLFATETSIQQRRDADMPRYFERKKMQDYLVGIDVDELPANSHARSIVNKLPDLSELADSQ